MTLVTAILTPTGLHPRQTEATSLKALTAEEPEGVYTVSRTYPEAKALLLDAHLDRLEESARLEAINLMLDRPKLRAALRDLIPDKAQSYRFRITVPQARPDTLYLALETLTPVPDEIRQMGAKTQTVSTTRQNPLAKSTAWMSQRGIAGKHLADTTYEGLLVDDNGYMLEGMSSNFYAIKGGTLYTAGEGILKGIARRALLESVGELCAVELTPINISDLETIDEAFLTSSSRGVVPIVQIDEQIIGDGQPGQKTRQLAARYDAWTEAHLEPI